MSRPFYFLAALNAWCAALLITRGQKWALVWAALFVWLATTSLCTARLNKKFRSAAHIRSKAASAAAEAHRTDNKELFQFHCDQSDAAIEEMKRIGESKPWKPVLR